MSEPTTRCAAAACAARCLWKSRVSPATSCTATARSAGCLDGPTGLVAEAHIFVADKSDYYAPSDALPQLSRSD